jgi:hypothetical protein
VRGPSSSHVLVCSLALLGCRSEAGTVVERDEPIPVKAEPEPKPDPKPQPEPEPERASDHADRISDLESMCRALDHDYVDGTLSDYYAKVEPKTPWGRERLREGEESITPGRLLQKAASDLAVDVGAPALAGCRKLFEDLDDLE